MSVSIRWLPLPSAPALVLSLLNATAVAQPLGIDLDRRYDQNTYLAAHNNYASPAYGWNPLLANQEGTVAQQLDSGAWCLVPDVYFMRQKLFRDSFGRTDLGFLMKMQAERRRSQLRRSSFGARSLACRRDVGFRL